MAGGKRRGTKRGASALTPDSSSSNKRRGGGRGTSSSSSAGPVRGEGGPEYKKEVIARQRLWKLSEARQQRSLQDVKIVQWALKTDSNGSVRMKIADFKSVLRRRRRLFKRVMSFHIYGIPVTQPTDIEKETYHIVETTLDGMAILQHLFRHSDGYLIAFRPVKSTLSPDAWEGWFHFNDNDIDLPHFFGQRMSLGWDCGYKGPGNLLFCKDTMTDLVFCLLAYTKDNCTSKSYGPYHRVQVLHKWMILFGECQRSAVFLAFLKEHHKSTVPVPLGQERDDLLHSWSNICYDVLNVYLALLRKEHDDRDCCEVKLQAAERDMEATVDALASKGFNIRKFIVYRTNPDGTATDRINGELSLRCLLGTGDGQLLQLIKYDDDLVPKIHKLLKKRDVDWPDVVTEPDSPDRAQVDEGDAGSDPDSDPEHAEAGEP